MAQRFFPIFLSSTSEGATDKMAAVKGAMGFSPRSGACKLCGGSSRVDPVKVAPVTFLIDKGGSGSGFGFIIVVLGSLDDAAFGSYTMI